MANEETRIAAEFQALPLEFLIAAPLSAAVKAQRVAAETTLQYIRGLLGDDGKPTPIEFKAEQVVGDTRKSVDVTVPILSIVPVPHLRIDALTEHFTFEIRQTWSEKSTRDLGIEIAAKTGALVSPWASASLKGSASSQSSKESVTNRSGQLEITVHASESPIPEGLARVLSLLASSVPAPVAQ